MAVANTHFYLFALLLSAQHLTEAQEQSSYDVIFEWKQLDYKFNSSTFREELISSGQFIPENNVITGIKVRGDRLFLTVPRWRSGVPATLVHVPYSASAGTVSDALLDPYPSWELNEQGNCDAIQYVQSMEIDQYGRMWVVDVGRVAIFESDPDNTCPPKLVLIDLETNEIVKTYEFPPEVVSNTSSFLNDIVVGCTEKEACWAYISDASDAKIIVYSSAENRAWYIQHPSMAASADAMEITLEGKTYNFDTAVDGIALSPLDTEFSTLYYCPLSSYVLYSVETATIQELVHATEDGGVQLQNVTELGRRPSQADGMTVDAKGVLYYGLLGQNALNTWDTSVEFTESTQTRLLQNEKELQWIDTLAIDEQKDAFATTNRLHRFNPNTYDYTEVNFRVIRFPIGQKSYMYPSNADTPRVVGITLLIVSILLSLVNTIL